MDAARNVTEWGHQPGSVKHHRTASLEVGSKCGGTLIQCCDVVARGFVVESNPILKYYNKTSETHKGHIDS